MKHCRIFYYHSLDLTFKSAQTLQVIKDYYYLSKFNIPILVYGTYVNQGDFLSIQQYLGRSNLKIIAKKRTTFGKIITKLKFHWQVLTCLNKKIIITRHYRNLEKMLRFKAILRNVKIFHEMHEESFPYIFKSHITKQYTKDLLLHQSLDCIIFTNFSQVVFFEQEFGCKPNKHQVLPNGVELEQFQNASMSNNFVLTYLGQFNQWKNVELIFAALSLLDKKYTLRIAGGKDDENSRVFIKELLDKYAIEEERVDYLGFVNNREVAGRVLNNSHVLLLPLGDNIQSKFLTSPMKLFEYMATKIPILAVDYPTVSLIATDKVFLSPNDASSFAEQIDVICRKNCKDFNFNSTNLLAKQYSYANRSQKFFKELILELC